MESNLYVSSYWEKPNTLLLLGYHKKYVKIAWFFQYCYDALNI